MSKPLTVSHKGKLAHLHEDGSITNVDGTPVDKKPDKPKVERPKRWHDPYSAHA